MSAPDACFALLGHFCEMAGPGRVLCSHLRSNITQALIEGDDCFVSRVHLEPDSPEHMICTSTSLVPEGCEEIVRKLCLRSLSCEQVRTTLLFHLPICLNRTIIHSNNQKPLFLNFFWFHSSSFSRPSILIVSQTNQKK
jgi:hypothetical protein